MLDMTQGELERTIGGAVSFGVSIGILIGIFVGIFLVYFLKQIYQRNFKMWYLSLKDKEKEEITEDINTIQNIFDKLAQKNITMFKHRYNDISRLKTYLLFKFMQN